MKLEPYVLWGEHRTTELLAMNIKDILINDPDITVSFIEYEQYQLSDYMSILYKLQEASLKGENIDELKSELIDKNHEYETLLKNKYGPLMFNLHDGTMNEDFITNIGLWIPPYIKEQQVLEYFLNKIADKHDLKIQVLCLENGLCEFLFTNIVVEFYKPIAIHKNYSSNKVRRLDKKFNCLEDDWTDAQTPDINHPEFQETVVKYATFMKDVLLDIHDLELTEIKD